jgi:hypothetical protein
MSEYKKHKEIISMQNDMMLEDTKVNCLSVMNSQSVATYLKLAEEAYKDKGGIKGQRTPLKTKTAQRIRARMVDDIIDGAVLPPLVIGLIVDKEQYKKLKNLNNSENIATILDAIDYTSFAIIDGMQRTTALMEAQEKAPEVSNLKVRIEYWIAISMNSLIYRMLVLNTGQVPWDIKRQLDTVYDPIVRELTNDLPEIDIRLIDQTGRRTSAGQYQSSKLIEYFLCYTSRKHSIDLKEKVAEDFARMDALDATSNINFLNDFKDIIRIMVNLDHEFSRVNIDEGRFRDGKDIFTSVPAGVGFVSAASVYLYGPPGFQLNLIESNEIKNNLIEEMKLFVDKLQQLNTVELGSFLEIELLNEKISAKSGKIGTFERDFFFKAFESLFKYNKKLTSMAPCWSAR